MSVTTIVKPLRRRRFLTYDLEWKKGEEYIDRLGRPTQHPQVRMAGLFDGFRYTWFETITDFLSHILCKENRGAWFYAHAGGLADMLFVLEVLADMTDYKVEAAFSGSSAIIVHVSRGKHSWHFVDSYWLLRDKLSNIAKFVGMEKGDVDFDDSSMAELVEYNELDCRILWHAIDRFENELLRLGGQLQMTLASSAMYLFRRRYLKSPIVTSEGINEIAREGYYASRVEVFQKRCDEAYYYDINSSFPFSMTFPCPGKLIDSSRLLPDSSLEIEGEPCLIDATVSLSYDKTGDFPPLPFRHPKNRSLYFPVGSWRGWFTNIDIASLLECGGSLQKVHEVLRFESRLDLADYALDLYARRLKAKNEGQDMAVMVYKLLLNSLYGKFAESRTKTGLVLHPPNIPAPWEENSSWQYLFPGAYATDKDVDVPHCHVPISVHITSRSRKFLLDHMRKAGNVYYCDTDGFACSNPNMQTSPELGGLKLESVIRNGIFHRPKVYMTESEEGEKKPRAKGFTLKPDLDELRGLDEREREEYIRAQSVQRFMDLLEGREIEMRRFVRIRELWKSGSVVPTERTIAKRFQDVAREKRKVLPNRIHTRPWTIDELIG